MYPQNNGSFYLYPIVTKTVLCLCRTAKAEQNDPYTQLKQDSLSMRGVKGRCKVSLKKAALYLYM